jgi:hypothetical protein
MTCKLKRGILATIAAMALLVIATSAASGAEFHAAGTGHTLWSAEQTGVNLYTFEAGTVTCKEMAYSGTTTVTTTTTIDLTPAFSGCTAFGFINTKIDTNGCAYRYHTQKEGSSTQGTSIVCPEGKSIVITAFQCEVLIPSQSGLTTTTYTDGLGDIVVDDNLTAIEYTQTSKSFPGCKDGIFTTGKYSGATTVRATNTAGENLETWVNKEAIGEGEFHAAGTGHTIWLAEQTGANLYTFDAGTVSCNKLTYSGTTTVTTTTTLGLVPSFTGCTAFGFVNTNIDYNGCIYRYHLKKEGSSTQGMSIDCPVGKAIAITAFNCEVLIPSQSGLTIVGYTNAGGDISVDHNITILRYTQISKGFPGCNGGSFTTGKYRGATTVKAFNTTGEALNSWVQ